MSINLLIFGYGKMGRTIHENADHINANVISIYDPNIPEYSKLKLDNVDVAIEFTHPDQAYSNIKLLLENKIPVVTGTTGWFHRIEEIKEHYNFDDHTLIYGANFSVGMNLFYEIIKNASKLINQVCLYDVYGYEAHHTKKADTPSGTAKVISEILLQNLDNKEKAVYNLQNETLKENEFSFSSVRAGSIVGYHEIGFDSDFDEIKISHNAKTRKGFALGALIAAKYAVKNKGIFNFKDIFNDVIKIPPNL